MPRDPERSTAVAVAVGASREEAAEVFGEYFEHAFLTSYDDFDDEVDLDLLGSLGLVAAGGLPAVLPRLLARDNTDRTAPLRVVLGLPPGPGPRPTPEALLAQCPGLRVGRVLESGDNVLWLLEGADATAAPEVAPSPPLRQRGRPDPDPGDPDPADTDPVEQSRTQEPPSAEPPWSRRVRQLGRRRLRWGAAALTALTALLVCLVSLVLLGRSGVGADGVLVALVLVVLVGQAALFAGLVRVVQLLREPRAGVDEDTRRFRKQLRRRTYRLLRLTRASAAQQEARAAELATSLNQELAVTRERLTAVTRLLARNGVLSREQAAEQLEQHAATRRHLDATLAGRTTRPELLGSCVETLTQRRPTSILTCGAGESAAFLALAAAQLGVPARVVSLEPDPATARSLEQLLDALGLGDRTEVRVGWCDEEAALAGMSGIELLVIQAPSGARARPAAVALPLPRDLLAERCTIVLDHRLSPTDTATACSWAALLPGFEPVGSEESADVTVLRRGSGPA